MKSALSRLLPSKGSLTARAIDAVGWNIIGTGAAFVLRLASNLVMTRLLMPEAFGILAFAMTFGSAAALLTDIGIHQSIVREKENLTPRFLRTAWSVKIVRSTVISICVLMMAGAFVFVGPHFAKEGSVMAEPAMPLLIAITALAPFIEGLISTNWDVSVRRMQYKRLVILEILATLIRILSQISFALASPTVWALLVGTFVGGFGKVALSHLYVPGPKMRFTLDKRFTRQFWDYGKWIMGSSTMSFVVNNTDKLVFGAVIPSLSMGLYVIAFIWIGAAQRVLDILSRSLGFSMVSEIMRDRPTEARRLMRKYQNVVDLGCVTAFFILLFSGPTIVQVLYTPIYLDAGVLIQLLSPLILTIRFSQLTNVVLASGNSRATFVIATTIAIGTVVLLFSGLEIGGFEGAITGMILARFVAVPYLLLKTAAFFGRAQTLYDALFFVFSVMATIGVYFYAT